MDLFTVVKTNKWDEPERYEIRNNHTGEVECVSTDPRTAYSECDRLNEVKPKATKPSNRQWRRR